LKNGILNGFNVWLIKNSFADFISVYSFDLFILLWLIDKLFSLFLLVWLITFTMVNLLAKMKEISHSNLN